MCIKLNALAQDAVLRELEQNYKTDEPVFGAMYMTPSGVLIDCSLFPNGHADISAWLNEQGVEIEYRIGEPSRLLYLKGWIRMNTKVGYIEEPHGGFTIQQTKRLNSIFDEGKFPWIKVQK